MRLELVSDPRIAEGRAPYRDDVIAAEIDVVGGSAPAIVEKLRILDDDRTAFGEDAALRGMADNAAQREAHARLVADAGAVAARIVGDLSAADVEIFERRAVGGEQQARFVAFELDPGAIEMRPALDAADREVRH